VIAYFRRLYGFGFIEACKYLNCWVNDDQPRRKPQTIAVPYYLVMDLIIDGKHYQSEKVCDLPHTEEQQVRRIFADSEYRLRRIHEGATEIVPGEADLHWQIMSDSWQLLAQWEDEQSYGPQHY